MTASNRVLLERSWFAPDADRRTGPQTEAEALAEIWSRICVEWAGCSCQALQLLPGWQLIHVRDGIGLLSMPAPELLAFLEGLGSNMTYVLCSIEDRLQRAVGDPYLSLLFQPR